MKHTYLSILKIFLGSILFPRHQTYTLTQSNVDQFIIFISNHGMQKITLDMANDENYVLPKSIFTCAICNMVPNFPILSAIQLQHFEIAGYRESEDTLNLPMLETLELRFCVDVDSVSLVYSKLENLSILSSYTITFECFNVNPVFTIIKHLYLNRTSLEIIIEQCEKLGNATSFKENLKEFCNLKTKTKKKTYNDTKI
ncbi:hypothetical protein R3W88_014172 [Solanum pinnatisectum]|uniref:Uncharacterized protein n=1 Tax=Solanum pinnatisectum TaxID=50273 RepID=A0AAV9KT97_9SOLN|nr:hypothetical protein R3W88_014172 [Solanum pinnatisectum]